ncbi:MAG TPA: RNA-binding S4 domain-containing protein [Burkholderiaceae bacterium]|nr:RNA-binding S4 domain-containing protein [Burkholderiaceae bacterium]
MTPALHTAADPDARLRLDKWLWAARFFKTRALAVEAIEKHRVRLNGAHTKPSKEVHAGDELEIAQGPVLRTVRVLGVSATRGPAPQAALLYSETEASVAQRLAQAEQRRLAPEPALARPQGRPTKRERRDLDALRAPPPSPGWDERWSAAWPAPNAED